VANDHINEQPLEYWREKFRERGFIAIDCVRPEVIANPRIQHWYRYNIVLYAEKRHLKKCPIACVPFGSPKTKAFAISGRSPTASVMHSYGNCRAARSIIALTAKPDRRREKRNPLAPCWVKLELPLASWSTNPVGLTRSI
jgi:hypothetical protein